MPIFEYKCKECGKSFDHLVLSKSQPLPECPARDPSAAARARRLRWITSVGT